MLAEALYIVAIGAIFSFLLVYADEAKRRWAWCVAFLFIVLGDGFVLLTFGEFVALIISRGWALSGFLPAFISFIAFITLLGFITTWIWRRKRQWNR